MTPLPTPVTVVLVANGLVAVLLSVWAYGAARRDHRNPLTAAAWQLFGGAVFGAIAAALAANAYWGAIERRRAPWGRAVFVTLFSLPAWTAVWAAEDARSRDMNAALWSALAFVLTAAGIVPWLIVLPVYFRIRPAVQEAVFDAARVRERFAEEGRLEDTNGDVLVATNVRQYFPVTRGVLQRTVGHVKAVDDVSLRVQAGETLALVGESGCGKTTFGRTILHLIPPTGGHIVFDGLPLTSLSASELRVTRPQMQIMFQDPYASLNPRMTVEHLVGEAMVVHNLCTARERRDAVVAQLERVGLAAAHLDRYAHEFSGGQRQRIGVARAIALRPKFIVCDEPVAALDVSIQAQIINLLQDLQQQDRMAYLFLSHDLSVVRHISDRVAVMYLGKIVELGARDQIFDRPRHPYTHALLSAIPVPDPVTRRERIILPGDVPTPLNPPAGCSFHPRCQYATPECSQAIPALEGTDTPGHHVACVHPLA